MSQELNIDLGESGLTVTANVYLLGALNTAGIPCPEIGGIGKYAGDFACTPNVAGTYQIAFFNGNSVSCGGGLLLWDGTQEIHQTGDSFANIGTAGAGLPALGDARVANLDAAVSSRSTFAGGAVASVTADVGITQAAADKVWGTTARTLTGFGTLVADIATAVWGAATRLLTAGTNIVLAKGTGVIGFNDIAAGAAMTLTDAYAAAQTAASQTSVNAIPTAPLLAANYVAPDNLGIAAIGLKTANLPIDPADESLIIAATDALGSAIAAVKTVGDAVKAQTDKFMFAGSLVKAHTDYLGAGAVSWTYTVTDAMSGSPIGDVEVWVTSDFAGRNVLASARTDQFGMARFTLDAGPVYVWRKKSGVNFVNPDSETVTA